MAKIPTQGTVIASGDGGTPEVFTAIGRITSYDGPGGESPEYETTELESTAKEVQLGLPDYGDFNFTINVDYANAGQNTYRADFDAVTKTSRNYRITYTTGKIITFAGYAKRYREKAQKDGIVTADCTVRLTGGVTRT